MLLFLQNYYLQSYSALLIVKYIVFFLFVNLIQQFIVFSQGIKKIMILIYTICALLGITSALHIDKYAQDPCGLGFYFSGKICHLCPPECLSCTDKLRCKTCSQGFQHDSASRKCSPAKANSLSSLTPQQLSAYFDHLNMRQPYSKGESHWLPSIINFRNVIHANPVLKMNWEYGISQCNNTLSNFTGDDVINLIDTACKTPPSYSHSPLAGFPINSIFRQLMHIQNGMIIFSNDKVNAALKLIFQDYHDMILSKKSLEFMNQQSPLGWFCPQAQLEIDYSQYVCDPSAQHYGFGNWNQWFLRKFKPGKRPVGAGAPVGVSEDNIIVSSCESAPLSTPIQPQRNVKLTDNFWVKDDAYSLTDMFGSVQFKKGKLALHFQGGTVYQGSLSSVYYHRWHAPLDGVIEDIYQIPGTYYLDQYQFAPVYKEGETGSSESFLTAVATRKIVVINAKNRRIGKIALVYVGMAEVSGCVSTVEIGDQVKKGEEIGHFQFGGSSHVIVFQKKANLKFSDNLYLKGENGQLQSVKQNLSSFLAEVIA